MYLLRLSTEDDWNLFHAAILVRRLYAMYYCNKTLLVTLSILLIAEVISETVVMGSVVAHAKGKYSIDYEWA